MTRQRSTALILAISGVLMLVGPVSAQDSGLDVGGYILPEQAGARPSLPTSILP